MTSAQWAAYAKAKSESFNLTPEQERMPVTTISWSNADAFCQWASKQIGHKVQLPTEAQWEKAARGIDGRIHER